MNEHVEQSLRVRTGQSEERDRIAEIIKDAEEDLARIKRESGG